MTRYNMSEMLQEAFRTPETVSGTLELLLGEPPGLLDR